MARPFVRPVILQDVLSVCGVIRPVVFPDALGVGLLVGPLLLPVFWVGLASHPVVLASVGADLLGRAVRV